MRARLLLALLLLAASAGAGEFLDKNVVLLDPFPREVGRGGALVIKGFLQNGHQTPELILIAPRGQTYLNKKNDIVGTSCTFTVALEEGAGPYRMELIARDRSGVKSAARFTVWHGVRRPDVEEEPPPPEGPPIPVTLHERLLEKRCLRLLNEFRDSIGAKALAWNEAVAERAREHAERMAKAERRLHKFGNVGILELLKGQAPGADGSIPLGSGWPRVDSLRPFVKPKFGTNDPRVLNHVVDFVLADTSLERMFEQYFVREAAFRLCAADPHALEAAVGAARNPNNPQLVYIAICIIQVNDTALIDRQDRGFAAALKACATRDPGAIRALGVWGRERKSVAALEKLMADEEPPVASAALDALLLLREEETRAQLAKREEAALRALDRREYAQAARELACMREAFFDRLIPETAARIAKAIEETALRELAELRKEPDPAAQREALEGLLRRCAGLPVAEAVRKALPG
ncbi:MAG: CAP domain-containing protein [Planctomycetaceae bacterium]